MRKTLDKLQHYLFPGIGDHLTDDKVAGLLCNEMSVLERIIAKRHLARCPQCRMWKEAIEESNPDQVIRSYRKTLARFNAPLTEKLRMTFELKLDSRFERLDPPRWSFRRFSVFQANRAHLNSVFATISILSVTTIAMTVYLWQRNAPSMTPRVFLTHAEKSDTSHLSSSGAVIYQAVRITMSKQSARESIARSIYRDALGKRHAKWRKLNATEEGVKKALIDAGLNWDEPLSASNYQEWYEHQSVHEDRIVRAETHLLRLTSTSSTGAVAEQSLTVRDTDFHPVARTVAFRDKRTFEIAELDFKVLPWNAVEADAFEPLGNVAPATRSAPDHIQMPLPPVVLSEEQLDETELSAKLMLNQLHADSREQIEIHRGSEEITVSGLVETEIRKRELES